MSQSKNKSHLSPDLLEKMKKTKEFNIVEYDNKSGQKLRKDNNGSKGQNVTVRDPTPALLKTRSGATEGALKSEPSNTEDQEKRKQFTS
jgi:hypothetical protein